MNALIQDLQLKLIREQVPVLANAFDITALNGGLTNRNYRIDTPAGSYVIRVSDAVFSAWLGINRDNEKVNTERACQAGIGPPVIDFLPAENALVIGWLNAKTLRGEDFQQQPGLIGRIARALKILHNGPEFQGDFYFPAIRKNYLKIVQDKGFFLPDGYLAMEPLIRELEIAMKNEPEEWVPCNNDLLAGNFMDDGSKIWIIDYEYAGQNEPSFEIGNLASEIGLTDDQLRILCDVYWQQHRPSKIARAMAWSMIARYGWVLWASIQEAVSSINFDFRDWGMKKWNSVLPELTGQRYQMVLERLNKQDS